MEIDNKLLINLGNKQGLKNKGYIEKSWMQDHLLHYLAKKQDNLIFKGGTALYKFYSLPRFSEDLDFSTKKGIEENFLKDFCEANHYTLNFKKIYDSYLYKIRFSGILTEANTVRVDINKSNSVYTFDVKSYISPYPDIPPFLIKVMSLKEILAEKICALLDRTEAKDLYDLFFILRVVEINKEIKDIVYKKLHDRNILIEKREVLKLKEKIKLIAPLWIEELKYFVLQELPDFKLVSDFVLKKFKELFS